LKLLSTFVTTLMNDEKAMTRLRKVFDPTAMLSITLLVLFHEKILHSTFNAYQSVVAKVIRTGSESRKSSIKPYNESLLGHLHDGIKAAIYSMALMYVVDIGLVIYLGLGFEHNVNVTIDAASMVLSRAVSGVLLTKLKDWVLLKRRSLLLDQKDRDYRREMVVNELSSTLIWLVITFALVERVAEDLKVSMSSIFAFGGIGSATLVLALRSVFENFIGGIMLRLQDKFRVGERIESSNDEGGWVESIGAFSTVVRRLDDSNVVIPNSVFIHDTLVNWSRTPYRRFTTQVKLPLKQVDKLPLCIDAIRRRVEVVKGVVSKEERDLLVTASGFSFPPSGLSKDEMINIDVDSHLYKSNQAGISLVKTSITNAIGLAMKETML
jgi:small-conductance mechanosensitive channel